MSTEETVDQIIEAIDSSTMLGAGWDCLSEAAKARFKSKLQKILDESLQSEVTENFVNFLKPDEASR